VKKDAITIAGKYILSNNGSYKDFVNLWDLYRNGNVRSKALPLKSQYINFYEIYGEKYPEHFKKNL
jgi:hypothetical protein